MLNQTLLRVLSPCVGVTRTNLAYVGSCPWPCQPTVTSTASTFPWTLKLSAKVTRPPGATCVSEVGTSCTSDTPRLGAAAGLGVPGAAGVCCAVLGVAGAAGLCCCAGAGCADGDCPGAGCPDGAGAPWPVAGELGVGGVGAGVAAGAEDDPAGGVAGAVDPGAEEDAGAVTDPDCDGLLEPDAFVRETVVTPSGVSSRTAETANARISPWASRAPHCSAMTTGGTDTAAASAWVIVMMRWDATEMTASLPAGRTVTVTAPPRKVGSLTNSVRRRVIAVARSAALMPGESCSTCPIHTPPSATSRASASARIGNASATTATSAAMAGHAIRRARRPIDPGPRSPPTRLSITLPPRATP